MKRGLILLFCLFMIPGIAQLSGQEFRVTGAVTDSRTGEALPGVNIVERGTTTGVVTNIDGNYSITVSSPDAVLVFSYVGFVTQQVPVNNRTSISISLTEEIRALDEIVVIGYGTQRRSDLTGAVVSVSEDRLKATISTSIDQALQGKAAGVQVFQNSG